MKKKEPRITYDEFCRVMYEQVGTVRYMTYHRWLIPEKWYADVLIIFGENNGELFGANIKWVDGDILQLVGYE